MNITVLTPDRLTPDHLEAWSRCQRADAAVDSPFFRPEYTRAVATVRSDVEVAILEDNGEPAGFFPFQRGRWGAGKPVVGRMTDFQRLVARAGLVWDADELVRGCDRAAWDFDQLTACQQPFRSHHHSTSEAPYLDLSGGFDAYQTERNQGGSSIVRKTCGWLAFH